MEVFKTPGRKSRVWTLPDGSRVRGIGGGPGWGQGKDRARENQREGSWPEEAGQGLGCTRSKGCSHSGQRWEQVPIQTQSEGDPCQAPRGGVGDKKRGEWWPSWRVLASKILGLVLWKEKGHSMIFSREVASSK